MMCTDQVKYTSLCIYAAKKSAKIPCPQSGGKRQSYCGEDSSISYVYMSYGHFVTISIMSGTYCI